MALLFFLSAVVHSCDRSFWTWHRTARWSFSHQCLDKEADNSYPQQGCLGWQSFFRETTGNLYLCFSVHRLLCNCIFFSLFFVVTYLSCRYIFFQLKPEFGMNFCLFGGLEGLDKFMRVHTAPSCSEEVSNLAHNLQSLSFPSLLPTVCRAH